MKVKEIEELQSLNRYELYKRKIKVEAAERKRENQIEFQRYLDESCKQYTKKEGESHEVR